MDPENKLLITAVRRVHSYTVNLIIRYSLRQSDFVAVVIVFKLASQSGKSIKISKGIRCPARTSL
jgi:hypothetical protein